MQDNRCVICDFEIDYDNEGENFAFCNATGEYPLILFVRENKIYFYGFEVVLRKPHFLFLWSILYHKYVNSMGITNEELRKFIPYKKNKANKLDDDKAFEKYLKVLKSQIKSEVYKSVYNSARCFPEYKNKRSFKSYEAFKTSVKKLKINLHSILTEIRQPRQHNDMSMKNVHIPKELDGLIQRKYDKKNKTRYYTSKFYIEHNEDKCDIVSQTPKRKDYYQLNKYKDADGNTLPFVYVPFKPQR